MQLKLQQTLKKHGISFDEAKSVFFDEFALQFFDQENSETADRFLMLGMSNETNLLLVCHCERLYAEWYKPLYKLRIAQTQVSLIDSPQVDSAAC